MFIYRYKVNQIFLLVVLLAVLTGCGGSSVTQETTTQTPTRQETTTQAPTRQETTTQAPTQVTYDKATHSGQVKDSKTENGLENVKVTIGKYSTTTDENGFYSLSDLDASKEAVVNFKKEGYLLGSTHIQLKSLSGDDDISSNYLEYDMHTINYQWDYNSSDAINGAHIMIDASVSYRDMNGKPYTGTNTAKLTFFDISSDEGKAAFPGAFKGINSNGVQVQFATYGLISILLEDNNSNRLYLSEGETVTLRFDKVSSLEKQNNLPLWYYDYEQGLWFEEGYAELQEDGSYKGSISHLGTWSVNRPLEEEAGVYHGRIINENGSSMSNVRVYAIGENWIGSDLTTDEDGMFEIEVIPGSNFHLSAYNYEDKYSATSGTIPAITSGDVIANRI